MRNNFRVAYFSYNQRVLVELLLVVSIVGILVALAMEIMPMYIKTSKLVEPLNLSKEVQAHMMIDSAFTGQWPDVADLHVSPDRWSSSLQNFDVSESGDILVTLQKELGFGEANMLIFKLDTRGHNTAFRFYSWHCGDSITQTLLSLDGSVKNTVPKIISHTICRN